MAKEEKKAPKLRFNGYTNDWERKKLGDVAKITPGGTPSKNISNYWYPKEIPWLSSGEINKEIIFSTDGMISKKGFNNSSAKWIKQDSVLIALAGQGKTRGKVAINRIPLTTNQSIAGIEPSNEVYYKFLYHQLTKDYLKLRLISSGDGSRGGLNKKLLNDYAVNLSSIDEQHKLGILLSHIDNTLQLHERKCEELTLIKKALLQKLFPKKDVIKPEVRYKNFNDAWEQRRFKDISKLSQGLQIAISKRFTHPGDGKLFYITNEFLNPNSTVKYYIDSPTKNVIAEKTDILMTRTGNTGKVVTDVEGVYHNNFFKISYNSSKIDRWFLYYLLNSYPIQREILVRAGNSTIPDLNHNDFYGIKIYIPTIEEQIKIGTFLTKVDSLIALHQYKLKKLKQLKKFLLQNMFI
ncbi:restriction endonuclease subunit S [Ligilactobacillus salivarius]|uniref:restriction endonuclease subunit S n=1 Tax=Ligilactobacillus salivarius TaxID=1624 RepID=UPI0011CB592C|nr:restriction endonuclease subunit S [Ligilactobacillus salivarius]MBX0283216.1 restriction endonuclease subunit S [Ligilactobacillus salivarius]TXJ84692.1 restriction endonuclease subunit S [Ligilactobacillus salivarius]